MKKVISILAIVALLSSCKKTKQPEPVVENNESKVSIHFTSRGSDPTSYLDGQLQITDVNENVLYFKRFTSVIPTYQFDTTIIINSASIISNQLIYVMKMQPTQQMDLQSDNTLTIQVDEARKYTNYSSYIATSVVLK
jgi:hypothetical protein